jgi:hypothetical protein
VTERHGLVSNGDGMDLFGDGMDLFGDGMDLWGDEMDLWGDEALRFGDGVDLFGDGTLFLRLRASRWQATGSKILVYSALGQLVLQMQGGKHSFAIAVPDEPLWEKQVRKIPVHVRRILSLSCLLVSERGVRGV